MLELLSSGLLSLWLEGAGMRPTPLDAFTLLAGPGIPGFAIDSEPETAAEATVRQYLQELAALGLQKDAQGIWLQSGPVLLASNQGNIPLPAASLTKIATSWASLKTWGPAHQFQTEFSATGPIQDGVVQGDLVIAGGGDPMFVWQEAIAAGNALNQMGIERVTGNLVIAGNFSMNFQSDALRSGELLKQALDSRLWPPDAQSQHSTMPAGTPKPQIEIAGAVKLVKPAPGSIPNKQLLLRRKSLPLRDILKEMNVHSNNDIAQMLADELGGGPVVAKLAIAAAGVPPREIQLLNGSGLGQENRISPRAASSLFVAIQRYLQPYGLTVADLFPVFGRDGGTMDYRHMPKASVVKTGTLSDVSALAGVLPTRDRGPVWFAIINRGENIEGLRAQQDTFLERLQKQWGAPPAPIPAIASGAPPNSDSTRLGAANRNEILFGG
ncbi:D-alanyl-D-alanine carboxypeptidase [Kamptonema formosum]|uniref:D-alanyl-D-alanine carboxypeptidase n=1 Tax=Kamptonema formosum TaxID=331992 RepID=UPI00034ADCF7|nr:D-alanyl-D-alanine carboxypeptidase [Oscillatoria sp. PCC 10802]